MSSKAKEHYRFILGSAKGEKLVARAVCIKNGKRTACYRIDVTDEAGNLAATVTTTGYYVGA